MSEKTEAAEVIEKTYVLRTCNVNMGAYGGFVWPKSGPVECPDWNPRARCGNGLHGLLMGAGDSFHLSRDVDANWLVVEIDAASVVDLDGKVKFPRGDVVFCGDREAAIADILSRGADIASCVYSTLTGGDDSTLTGGDDSTLIFKYWDGEKERCRIMTYEVDGDQVKSGVKYRLIDRTLTEVPDKS
ncbi:hypothetical protein Gdia_2485 [Gluconacetobacter diazotrophicus PA1 5]|uniref:DUF7666 domain-containing protein n=1 Tax=Gluconacetobacter diazotrophicus TaxID=33996 RepID=UPI000173DB3E|nr:hypothetical protein [Gluconacetobacter diazotrophicus]ACI52229.1 hypothetical protein Gdia_2485 [Gluconacetobacter diazotrophicus PA1 5]